MPQNPSKTSREKVASPIRKADATTAAEEETRLQVIAHYNYTGVVVGQSDLSALRLWASPLKTLVPTRAESSLLELCRVQPRVATATPTAEASKQDLILTDKIKELWQ